MVTEERQQARRLELLRSNFDKFVHGHTTGAMVLAVATVVAMVLANSPIHEQFLAFWDIHAGFTVGNLEFDQSLLHWVDDALMAIFFFVVGLEIKREFIVGELSNVRGAALPIIAAVGGMVVPAGLYIALNAGGPGAAGWGVPMATDIAFALGVLALLGSRVPAGLKVFLTALAIADDIGAIMVIALFYTDNVEVLWLLGALVPLAAMIIMNRKGVDNPAPYFATGTALWFCFLNSGIHATLAGVIAALAIPAAAKLTPLEFTNVCRLRIDEIENLDVPGAHTLQDNNQQKLALDIQRAAIKSTAPLQRLEFTLAPVSTLFVLPLFALANAGVPVEGAELGSRTVLGVLLGLAVGKPLGIGLFTWLAVRFRVGSLPTGVNWKHIIGVGMLAGIGFTMSLFVANLAFTDAEVAANAKVGILVTSMLSGALGYLWLRFVAARSEA